MNILKPQKVFIDNLTAIKDFLKELEEDYITNIKVEDVEFESIEFINKEIEASIFNNVNITKSKKLF